MENNLEKLKANYQHWLSYVHQILGYAQGRIIHPDNARKFLDEVENANTFYQNWFFKDQFNRESFLKAIVPAVKARSQTKWLQHETPKNLYKAIQDKFGIFDYDGDGEAITFFEDDSYFVILATKVGVNVYYANHRHPLSFYLENGLVVLPTAQTIKDLAFFNRRTRL